MAEPRKPKKVKETMAVEGIWHTGAYKYKAPTLLQEYIDGLKDHKLIGSMCEGCGKVIVLPRNICGRCHRRMDGRRVVSNKGTVTSLVVSQPVTKGKFVIFGMDPVDTGMMKEGEILIPVFVRFDGSDSNVHVLLLDGDPKTAGIGLRVEAVFADEPAGALGDLVGVKVLK
jgi:uncharacterized OB-fold protein